MSGRQNPDEWRDLLRNSYPDEIAEAPRGRAKRRAQKAYRQRKRQAAYDKVREEREKEPVTSGGVLVVILVLLAIGAVSWLLRGGGDDDGQEQGKGRPAVSASPSPSSSPTPSASPSPSVDAGDSDAVARAWARAYYTRDPYKDQTHRMSVDRASRWMTSQLRTNLSESSDPEWGKLVSRGGVSKVTAVKVAPAGTKLPADTPLRVWRTLTVAMKVHGYDDYTENRTVRAELTRSGDQWQVSRVLGV